MFHEETEAEAGPLCDERDPRSVFQFSVRCRLHQYVPSGDASDVLCDAISGLLKIGISTTIGIRATCRQLKNSIKNCWMPYSTLTGTSPGTGPSSYHSDLPYHKTLNIEKIVFFLYYDPGSYQRR
ncbi:hypothetical protein L596_019253 [Steinernema carpocapsae]|uniref:Uncharacterized protein n=1 Tax=Steinernema carpocapsae TaxID=34508 RepID=A0A4U5MPU3_STECR|nr:hypothetical protein L596_019253 [Steinernema carpocapsae]